MRISDWSSDVCSSDLECPRGNAVVGGLRGDNAGRVAGAVLLRRLGEHARLLVGDKRGDGSAAAGGDADHQADQRGPRSEEHTSELQSLMRISSAVFCLQKTN